MGDILTVTPGKTYSNQPLISRMLVSELIHLFWATSSRGAKSFISLPLRQGLSCFNFTMVPVVGLEPTRLPPWDFKSHMFTNFIIQAVSGGSGRIRTYASFAYEANALPLSYASIRPESTRDTRARSLVSLLY